MVYLGNEVTCRQCDNEGVAGGDLQVLRIGL